MLYRGQTNTALAAGLKIRQLHLLSRGKIPLPPIYTHTHTHTHQKECLGHDIELVRFHFRKSPLRCYNS